MDFHFNAGFSLEQDAWKKKEISITNITNW